MSSLMDFTGCNTITIYILSRLVYVIYYFIFIYFVSSDLIFNFICVGYMISKFSACQTCVSSCVCFTLRFLYCNTGILFNQQHNAVSSY